ncbi:MAG: hypothetical protein NC209_05705 [Alistipes sp.]|nr:hypothetical protein [Alistipes senegalensis]MCM1250619.1 hypothetical protein [Alistipes sp.]
MRPATSFVGRLRSRKEPLPARQVAVALPLASFGALPEGVPVSAREGPLRVEVRHRGDSLTIEAHSDSVPRTVMRVECTELRRQRDSSVGRVAGNRLVLRSDSLRQEARTQTVVPRARAGGCWRWLLAGAALGLVVVLRFCRRS